MGGPRKKHKGDLLKGKEPGNIARDPPKVRRLRRNGKPTEKELKKKSTNQGSSATNSEKPANKLHEVSRKKNCFLQSKLSESRRKECD